MTDHCIQTLEYENTEQRAKCLAGAHRDRRGQGLRDGRLAWERECYGCTVAELRDCIEEHRAMAGPSMMAASCASDAQDSMAFAGAATSVAERDAHLEQGRQAINRLKFVLTEELREPRGW